MGRWDAVLKGRRQSSRCTLRADSLSTQTLPGEEQEGQSTGLILYCKEGQSWHCGTHPVGPQCLSWVVAWSWLRLTLLLLQLFPPLHRPRPCYIPCIPSDAPTLCPWEGPGVQAQARTGLRLSFSGRPLPGTPAQLRRLPHPPDRAGGGSGCLF